MFGPREQLLTFQEPVVRQFLNGRREGPIGMSEEKDVAQVEAEMKALEERGGDAHNGVGPKGATGGDAVPPQLTPTEGLPERKGERRRQERVARMLHEFNKDTQAAIRTSLPEDLLAQADSGAYTPTQGTGGRRWAPEPDAVGQPARAGTATLPRQGVRSDGDRQAQGSRAARRAVLADPAAGRQRQPVRVRARRRPRAAQAAVPDPRVHRAVLVRLARLHPPAALVSISFGSVISLQLGSLIRQFGAQSFSGAAVLAVIRRPRPYRAALLVAGAGGSAICADLGARTIREEIDAMEVLGINPIQRLVVPRVLAAILVARPAVRARLVVGVAGGYYFNVVLQGVTPGAYVHRFSALAKLPDLSSARSRRLSSASSPGSSPRTRASPPGAGRRAWATR